MTAVSVCIPTYNGSDFLASSLDSALAQSFEDVELIICDDCSTDDTTTIAEQYAKRDSRVRLYRNPVNLGLVENWNHTIAKASGEWIKLLFQDDILYPDCISELFRTARQTRGLLIASFRDFIYERKLGSEGDTFYDWHAKRIANLYPRSKLTAEEIATLACENIGLNLVGEPPATLIHRSVFDRVGYFNSSLAQRSDTEFWIRSGIRFGVEMVRHPLVAFRVHAASASAINKTTRDYADRWLDPLIILHQYLFDPIYAPLRKVAKSNGSWPQLRRQFWDKAHDAKRLAWDARAAEDEKPWQEWKRTAEVYSRLERIPFRWQLSRKYRRAMRRLGHAFGTRREEREPGDRSDQP